MEEIKLELNRETYMNIANKFVESDVKITPFPLLECPSQSAQFYLRVSFRKQTV